MSYSPGQTILAADFTAFRGSIAPSSPYPSLLEATRKVAALIGVGYGSRGYGQTSTTLNGVAIGDIVTASTWNSLFSAMGSINIHTGSGLTVPASVLIGSPIQALNGSSGRPDLSTLIATLDSNRLLYSLGQMSLTSAISSVRTSAWSTQVTHEFTATFVNEDAARYFFNTGGQIYAAASRTGGSASALNNAMTTMLSNMGTIKVGANATTYTGTGGTVYPIGYYGLTNNYQTLFLHTGGSYGYSYGYSNISYTLRARVENISGANGGNGSTMRFQAIFATGYPSYSYSIDGILTSAISQLKAGGVLTVIAPSYATTSPL
jgi:hypothetical protein